MAMRLKEDVRNEKIIRGLLKLPANKRCINCNSLGPQYVCTNFWTFICTNCSGIHREFTHRVKSVSMAKFTSQEVNALQEGGNERARELFFRDWDHQRNSFPDSSNVDKVRTFIKHVYVDRRYTGEGSADKPLRVKGDREDNERRRQEASLSGSRSPTIGSGSQSPQYDETHGRRHVGSPVSCGRNDDRNLRQNYGGKSPTYEQGRAEYRRSPGRLGVDTRLRDDKMPGANQTQTFEDSRLADGAGKTRSSSINFQNQKDLQIKSPIVRPVRDILGEDAPALVVGEPTKSSIPPTAQIFAPVQTSPNTTNISSSSINSLEPKRTALSSLIDFDIVGEHASAKNREEPVSQHVCTPNEENWASFDSVPVQKELQANTMLNSLDGTLDLLNGPGDTSVASATIIGTSSPSKTAAEHYARQQNEPSSFTNVTTASQSTISSLAQPAVETINSQGRPISDSLNTLETSATSSPAKSSNVPYDKQTAENPQPSQKMEAHSTGRKELPADLFAALYPNTHAPAMGWQTNPNNFAAGYGMQYPMPMVIPQFSYIPQPANPFDVSNQPRLPHSSTFPSMESLQGVLPSTINSSGLVRSSSFGANPLPQWMPQQQPGGYMGQHILGSTSHQNYINAFQMGNQGYGEATNQPPAFRPPIVEQHSDSRYSQPNTPSTFFSTSGNPFG